MRTQRNETNIVVYIQLAGFVSFLLLLNTDRINKPCWAMFFFMIAFAAYICSLYNWPKNRIIISEKYANIISAAILYMVFVIILFALGYQALSGIETGNVHYNVKIHNDDIKNLFDYIYYSTITATSLGYGDVVPLYKATWTKLLTMAEVIFGPIFIIALLSLCCSNTGNNKS